jgi:hypothetical protein
VDTQAKKWLRVGNASDLGTQGKSPGVMGEIIDHHQVVLIARHAENRRSPQVAMDKIKHRSGM